MVRRLLPVLLFAAAAPLFSARAQMAPVPAKPRPTGNCTHPDAATRPDCAQAIAFLGRLQTALKSNRPQAVAPLVHYPLLVTTGGRRHIASARDLLSGYDHIFTAEIRAAILSATPDDVWGNAQGFMIGRGVLWFDSFGAGKPTPDSFRVITINPVYP